MRADFEEMLRKQREEMTAEMTAMVQQVMDSVCYQGNFQQVLRGDFQQGTSWSAAPAPQGPPAPEKKVIEIYIRRIPSII